MKKLLGSAIVLALLALGSLTSAQPPDRVRVLIGFRGQAGPSEEALVRSVGGDVRYRYHLVPAIAATVPVTAIEGLQQNPNVTVVEPDGTVQAIDAELDAAWGVKRIGAGLVHDSGNRGDGIRVAIVDTGIDYTHPDLDGNYVDGYDFVNGDPDPMDDHGHGTHCAGTVAAEDDDVGVVGVAPKALLYGVKVLSASGSGYWSDIVAGIQWAADHGVRVTSNSYGGSGYPGTVVEDAFQKSYDAGMLHVAAAGNSGSCPASGDTVGYPAKFSSVIAVAATSSTDARACFSSTGPDVEIAAPGVSIYSTRLRGGYTYMSGTSMATPHVAGAAALVLASGELTNVEVRQRLDDTADDLGAAGWDPEYGFGIVDADEAAAPSAPGNTVPVVTITGPANGSTFQSGDTITFNGTATDAEDGDLTAGLTWTSSLDGGIGTGGSFDTAALSTGTHTISASVTDSGGKSGSDSITVTVSAPSSSMADVASIDFTGRGGRYHDKNLVIDAAVVDESGNGVSGATVSMAVSVGGVMSPMSGVTDSSGHVSWMWKNSPNGCYVATVVNVSAPGLAWDGTTPPNGNCSP